MGSGASKITERQVSVEAVHDLSEDEIAKAFMALPGASRQKLRNALDMADEKMMGWCVSNEKGERATLELFSPV